MKNQKGINLLILISLIVIIVLVISSITLSVFIFKKEKELKKQKEEIEKLNNQLEYYENNTNSNISLLNDICEVKLWLSQ